MNPDESPRPEDLQTEHTAACGWCGIEVVSFAAPVALSGVTLTHPVFGDQAQYWAICADCHVDLLKLIASKEGTRAAPESV